jgi:hypothetical protein
MIQTDRKFYSIKKTCQRRIYKCTALALIFGPISQSAALKDMGMRKVLSFKFIVKCFKKLKLKSLSHIRLERIWNNK